MEKVEEEGGKGESGWEEGGEDRMPTPRQPTGEGGREMGEQRRRRRSPREYETPSPSYKSGCFRADDDGGDGGSGLVSLGRRILRESQRKLKGHEPDRSPIGVVESPEGGG